MKQIPLIRAATVAEIADALDAHGAHADGMLEHARIPLRVREHPQEFVPGRSVWIFAGEISRRGGPPDFLFSMPRVSDWRRCRWVSSLAHATTLGDALRGMSVSWMREIPMVRMGVTVGETATLFWRLRVPDVRGWDGNQPAEQYTLSHMLQVVRAATGPEWHPPAVGLESPSSGWGASSADLGDTRKHYGQPLLSVVIPTRLLSLPISIKSLCGPVRGGKPAGEDFESSLRQVLRAHAVDGPPDQGFAAETLGMSGRNLRRQLAACGTSWRSVVQDVKFAKATERLLEGRIPVREVAEELGFTDTPNFTRFFRARAGIPPSRWREHVESERARLALP
jgi:AraC-like DNA-binding protein